MSSLTQTSAKIYQFPVGGRGGVRRLPTGADTASSGANILTCVSWYHEAAILDESSRKPQ